MENYQQLIGEHAGLRPGGQPPDRKQNSRSQVRPLETGDSMRSFPDQQRVGSNLRDRSQDHAARSRLLAVSHEGARRPIISQGFSNVAMPAHANNAHESQAHDSFTQQRLHMKNIQNLRMMQTKLEQQQPSGSRQKQSFHHQSAGRFQKLDSSQSMNMVSKPLRAGRDSYNWPVDPSDDLARATAALAAIKQKKDQQMELQQAVLSPSMNYPAQNDEAGRFEDPGHRARTNHGARELPQSQGFGRHQRNISHQDIQGAQVQRMRSLKYLQNNFVESQNHMSASDNIDQFVSSSKYLPESQHNLQRQIQSPSLINLGANLMNEATEYGGRRELGEAHGNEMMSQTQYSSDYWQQLGSTSKELRKINVNGSQTISKFIKDRVLQGTLRKSQAQPSQRQNGLKDSYQRLGNQFMPPQTGGTQFQHGFTPRNLTRLLKQRASMTRGSQGQGRSQDRNPQPGSHSNPRPAVAPSSISRDSTGRLWQHDGSVASATKQALQPLAADRLVPADKASIDDKYSALQRDYDDIFKTQQQPKASTALLSTGNQQQDASSLHQQAERLKKEQQDEKPQLQRYDQGNSNLSTPPDGWRIVTEVGINRIHMGIELEQNGSIGLKYSLQQRNSLQGPLNWIPVDLNAQCKFEPTAANERPQEAAGRDNEEQRQSQTRRTVRRGNAVKKRANQQRHSRAAVDEAEDNILHIQHTKRSSGAPSFIESKNTSRLAVTQQRQTRNQREKSETNRTEKEYIYGRTSSMRTQAPQVPTNLAPRSHKSPSRQGSNEMEQMERQPNKNNMPARPFRHYESLKNSQSHRSEMASPEMRIRDGQAQDYVPNFAEYVKNKVIERESKMSGASPAGSNTSRSRVNEAADLPRSTFHEASKESQEAIQKKLSFSENSAREAGTNARKSMEGAWKELQHDSSRNAADGGVGSRQISNSQRNNSNDAQQTTRTIYLQGEKEPKDTKKILWSKPMGVSRGSKRTGKRGQLKPTRSFDSRVKKVIVNPPSSQDTNERERWDTQRSQSQSNPRRFKDTRPPGTFRERKPKISPLSPESLTRKHNDMAQTTRDVKKLLIQNEAFKDVDQEEISKLLAMLQHDKNREAIAKVKEQSPKVSKESSSKRSPSQSPRLAKERKDTTKAEPQTKASAIQSHRNPKEKQEGLAQDQSALRENKKLPKQQAKPSNKVTKPPAASPDGSSSPMSPKSSQGPQKKDTASKEEHSHRSSKSNKIINLKVPGKIEIHGQAQSPQPKKKLAKTISKEYEGNDIPITYQSSEQKKKTSDESSKAKANPFGQSAGGKSDTQTQNTAAFVNVRVSDPKQSQEKQQSAIERSAMKPSAGGQEEDPARASSHSMQKGPNSADIEIFNQELQNQINQDTLEDSPEKKQPAVASGTLDVPLEENQDNVAEGAATAEQQHQSSLNAAGPQDGDEKFESVETERMLRAQEEKIGAPDEFESMQTDQQEQERQTNTAQLDQNNQDSSQKLDGQAALKVQLDQVQEDHHQEHEMKVFEEAEAKIGSTEETAAPPKSTAAKSAQIDSFDSFILQTIAQFEGYPHESLQSGEVRARFLISEDPAKQTEDLRQNVNPFELFHQKTSFQVKDYVAMQSHQFSAKPHHKANDAELAKLKASPGMGALKLKEKSKSEAPQAAEQKSKPPLLGGLVRGATQNSNATKEKSPNDTTLASAKQFTVDQAMKIPFFVKVNQEREKQLRVKVLNQLDKSLKNDIKLWQKISGKADEEEEPQSLARDLTAQQPQKTLALKDGGSPTKALSGSMMDAIFNRSSQILKQSPLMRKSTQFMSRVNAKTAPEATFGSNDRRSSVSSPHTFGETPASVLGAKRTKTVRFDLERDSKGSEDGSNLGILQLDQPRLHSLAQIAEDSERSGEQSSSSCCDSQESATSLLTDISMMLGDDNRSSSSHCESHASGSGGYQMRYKIIQHKQFEDTDRAVLVNLKLKQQLQEKMRSLFAKKLQDKLKPFGSAPGLAGALGGSLGGGLAEKKAAPKVPNKFDKYPQFQKDKQNFDGLIQSHHRSLLGQEDDFHYLHEQKASHLNHILSEAGSDDDRSLINSDVTDFSEFYQDKMKSIDSDRSVYTIDEAIARGRRLNSLRRSFSADPGQMLARYKITDNNAKDTKKIDGVASLKKSLYAQSEMDGNKHETKRHNTNAPDNQRRKSLYTMPLACCERRHSIGDGKMENRQRLLLSRFFANNCTNIDKFDKMDLKNLTNLSEWLELNNNEQIIKGYIRHGKVVKHPFGKKHNDLHAKTAEYMQLEKNSSRFSLKTLNKKQNNKYLKIRVLFKFLERLQDLVDPNENFAEQIKRDQDLKNNLVAEQLAEMKIAQEKYFFNEDPLQPQLNYHGMLGTYREREESISDYSISDECDGEVYNNQVCQQSIHNPAISNHLIGTVIKSKNSHFEIFKILVQTKLDKIKNRIMKLPGETKQFRNDFIDKRLKQIKQIIIKNEEAREKFSKYLSDNSEVSSLFESEDSIEDTSKYMYVEDLEQKEIINRSEAQLREQQNINRMRFQNIVSVISKKQTEPKINNTRAHIKQILADGNLYKDLAKDEEGNLPHAGAWECGFRYGKKSPLLKQFKEDMTQENIGLGRPNPNLKIIKLRNGLPLDISKKPNVNFDVVKSQKNVHPTIRERAVRDLNEVQSYYNFIKDHMNQKPQSSSVFYLKYKRKHFMNEKEINEQYDSKTFIRLFINLHMLKMMKFNDGKAIQMNLYGNKILTCVNPFINRYPEDSKILAQRQKELEMKQKLEQQTQKKRYFTAMEYKKGMIMANQKDNKNTQVEYAQGTKSKNFKFVSKLQSLGRVSQWRQLVHDMKDLRLVDMDLYESAKDPDSGSAIYVLFEVLHVKRKTPYDHHIEQKQLTQQLRLILDSWAGPKEP